MGHFTKEIRDADSLDILKKKKKEKAKIGFHGNALVDLKHMYRK